LTAWRSRNHGVADTDILRAWENAIRYVVYNYDCEDRLLVIGPSTSGAVLELVAVPVDEPTRIIHADKLRPRFHDYLSDDDHQDQGPEPIRDAVHFRRIIAARKGVAAAEDELRNAVAAGR